MDERELLENFWSVNTKVMIPNLNYFSTWLFYDVSIENGKAKLNDIRNLDIEEQNLEAISLRLIHSVSMLPAFSEYYKERYGANAKQSKFNKKINYVVEIGTGSENFNVTKLRNFEDDNSHVGDNIEYVLEQLPYLIQDYLRELSEEYDGLECIIDGIDNVIERNRECSGHYLEIDVQLALFINDNLDLFEDYI